MRQSWTLYNGRSLDNLEGTKTKKKNEIAKQLICVVFYFTLSRKTSLRQILVHSTQPKLHFIFSNWLLQLLFLLFCRRKEVWNLYIFCLVFQGQSKIADHLKRSYSMSDLSTDSTDGRQFRKDSVNEEEFGDETGTCSQSISQHSSVTSTLGPTFNEFSFYEHLPTTCRFLCIKIVDSQC